jgi:hypothetical protein
MNQQRRGFDWIFGGTNSRRSRIAQLADSRHDFCASWAYPEPQSDFLIVDLAAV